MASVNQVKRTYTAEGGKAANLSKEVELKRSVMSCFLWEDSFYEDGVSIAERIQDLTKSLGSKAIPIMNAAKFESKLRHVPLWMAVALASVGKLKADDLASIITRADDMTEFLALYWKDGKTPLSKQVKLGLAKAFAKFDEYSLAKYDRDGAVKIRDVLRLVHPKPSSPEQAELWGRAVKRELKTPDTWEVALSGGADKNETFTRLIKEGMLGDLALLRNMRNIVQSGVDRSLVRDYIGSRTWKKILPFQFINAAKYAPGYEDVIETSMLKSMESFPKFNKRVAILVDVSGSMSAPISAKSDLQRIDAAKGVAMFGRELFTDCRVFKFNQSAVEVPARRGFALGDAIGTPNGGTYMWQSLVQVGQTGEYDAVIVITDEQTADNPVKATMPIYICNVAAEKRSVANTAGVIKIDGWSENVFRYIGAHLMGVDVDK